MDLFNDDINILPCDGEANYYGHILSLRQSLQYFETLLQNVKWENDRAIIYGKAIVTKRKVAWYGDENFRYTYSQTTKTALPWIPELLEIKMAVEKACGERFNSCLLNLYHSGEEGMAWHSDAERDLKKNGAIASLSLGADRKFSLKHKESKQLVSLVLEKGSLLVMKGTTQTHWLHSLPTTKKVKTPRINLTFRTIVYTVN